jgi:Tol biopolymer transport system component
MMVSPCSLLRPRRAAISALTGAAVFFLAACSLFGGEDPRWDTDVPESAPVEARLGTWGPDGERIAFVHTPDSVDLSEPGSTTRQLWTLNLETRERQQVLRGPLFTPHWSPDGEAFVFHSTSIPQYLFRTVAGTDSLYRLTGPGSPNPDLENTTVGRWSPSGDRILYAVEAGEKSGVYVMMPDGSDVTKLVGWSVMPAWFPSGEKIAYVSWDQSVDDPARKQQIYLANADGSNQRKLTDLDDSRYLSAPHVAPDGSQIAFAYNEEIHLMAADGSNVRQVTGGEGDAAQPMWSPDGTQILFFRRFFLRGGQTTTHLYLLDVETLEVTPVFPAADA